MPSIFMVRIEALADGVVHKANVLGSVDFAVRLREACARHASLA